MKYIKILCLAISYVLLTSTIINAQKNIVHIVESGDTVYSISKRYGISKQQIYDLNPWAKETLRIGGKLLLPNVSNHKLLSNGTYVIKNGDTMYSVCKKFGITQEQLMSANKGLSVTKFPSGRGIMIPNVTEPPTDKNENEKDLKNSSISDKTNEINKDISTTNFVKLTLALPFAKSGKYVEFYKGFLMGVNEEKIKGVSVDLNVVDLSSSNVNYDLFKNRDIVIGGVSNQEISDIAHQVNKGYYVVPFNGDDNISDIASNIIQINNPDIYIDEMAVNAFLSEYKNKNIYFVDDYGTQESQFSRMLKIKLTDQKKKYKIIDLTGNIPIIEPNSVLIPIAKDEKLLKELFAKIGSSDNFQLFGYRLWQSFNRELINKMHRYNTKIYTTFYFDNQKPNSVIFANKFRAWYSYKLSNSFPQFGVMGYEIAKYFIESYYKNKNVLGPLSGFDPMQMNINIEKTDKGYTNKSLFFVSFNVDGTTSKISIK